MLIYSKITDGENKQVKILGLTIYKKEVTPQLIKRSCLGGIFKIKIVNTTKKYYIFGIRVYKKTDKFADLYNSINLVKIKLNNLNIEQYKNSILVTETHKQLFPQFKNIHYNRIGVLVGTAPSLSYYKNINGALHFCVNAALEYIEPDYWFSIDSTNVKKYYNKLKVLNFKKFIGQALVPAPYRTYRRLDTNESAFIPDCVIEQFPNSHKFYIDHPSMLISRNIEFQPLPDLGSSVFSALYFAIYTGCKKIYIVGCDCTNNGYFHGGEQKPEWHNGEVALRLNKGWAAFKEHVEIFHPDVKLISVNPVGLRGIFKDVYTKSYIEANPEIKEELGDSIVYLEDLEENKEHNNENNCIYTN